MILTREHSHIDQMSCDGEACVPYLRGSDKVYLLETKMRVLVFV